MVVEEQNEPFLRLISPNTDLIESASSVRHGEGGKWCSTEPVWGELTTDMNWQSLPDIGNDIKHILVLVYVVIDVVFHAKNRFLARLQLQLPQCLRSGQIARVLHRKDPVFMSPNTQVGNIYATSVADWSSKWRLSLKLFKCCPRFPFCARQNKEATWSTPRTAHNNNTTTTTTGLSSTQQLAEQTFPRKLLVLIPPTPHPTPHVGSGGVLFAFPQHLSGVDEPDRWAMAAAVFEGGPLLLQSPPCWGHHCQQIEPGCHNPP